jgi:anti-sigma regulatory factor (Ser/Thr protein kinase)
MSDRWPLRSYLELGALPGAVPCARLHTRQVVWEWGLREPIETVELVVSEIVTNAVRASEGLTGSRYSGNWLPGPIPVRLWLSSDQGCILVQVWDGNDRMPQRQKPELEAENGRGLTLVEALCQDWGVYRLEGASGKVVWTIVATSLP